jgi:Flp pilus assembly pilin Flp
VSTSLKSPDGSRHQLETLLVEYGLLVGLIALAAVTGITLVGGGISTMFTGIGNYLSGLPLP